MARKAGWILVLLVALLVISVSAAFAANATRPVQASLTPKQEISTKGESRGIAGMSKSKSYGSGDCPFESESAAAY